MGLSVYFANSAKPENSTAQFSLTGLTPYTCILKAGTSVSNPTIVLQVDYTDFLILQGKNVAYISELSRYYFVTDWTFDGRLVVCALSVDVLASYWSSLSSKTFFVSRSASNYDISVVDTEYPATAEERSTNVQNVSNPFIPPSIDFGCYVVGILSKNGGVTGCIEYYVMPYTVFVTFMTKVFTITNYGTLGTTGTNNDTFTSDLAEAIINPLQYVSSIMWFPWSTTAINNLGIVDTTTSIAVGYTTISMGISVYYFDGLNNARVTDLISFTVNHHPEHNDGESFLNLSPYSEYRLNFYPFGTFTIDGEYLQNESNLYCLWSVDLRTGRGVLNVGTSVSGSDSASWVMPNNFLTAEAPVGVPIPTSTVQTQMPDLGIVGTGLIMGGANGLFSGLGTLAKDAFQNIGGGTRLGSMIGETIGGAIDTAVETVGSMADSVGKFLNTSGVGNAILQVFTSPSMSGTQGSISLYPKQNVSFISWFKERTATDNTHKGTPLCKVAQLSTLSGYTVCNNAIADISGATYPEKRKIENYLNTGFYIEPPPTP